ncbi:MAG TPA: response regulator [Candidatus Paceibacterota bacterium]|nr:response regulator [Candidatus Paceibacterota bacterium]
MDTQTPQRSFKILVVDDNQMAADALAKLLTLRGHTVEAVYSGKTAIEYAPIFLPEVLLLDIGLPDIEGYEVARTIGADARVSTTMIALTGFGQPADVRAAEKAGFSHHLTKPAGLAEIEEVLAKIV